MKQKLKLVEYPVSKMLEVWAFETVCITQIPEMHEIWNLISHRPL